MTGDCVETIINREALINRWAMSMVLDEDPKEGIIPAI
jgi:hypothetical protein